MQPISENDIMQVVVEGTNETTPWAWVSHWIVNTASSPETFLDQLANHVTDEFINAVKELLTDKWQAQCLRISRVAPQPMNVYLRTAGYPYVGTQTGDGVPNTAAVVVRFTTDNVGPRFRGRMYLCGWPEDGTDGGLLEPSPVTTLNAALGDLITAMSVAGESANMCIFSRTSYNPAADPPQAVGLYAAAVSGYEVQYNLGTIRNRRRPLSINPG